MIVPLPPSPGDYYRGPPGEPDQDPDEDWVQNLQAEGRAYQEYDEDADVDESGNASCPFKKKTQHKIVLF